MALPHNLPRLVRMALIITVSWQLAGVFFASQHHAIARARANADVLEERLIIMSAASLVWALFTPFLIAIADRFPIRKRALPNLAIVTLVAVMIAVARAIIDPFIPALFEPAVFERVLLERSLPTPPHYGVAVAWLAHTHLLLCALIIGLANFLRIERENAERRRAEASFEAELAQARLRRLRADLDPHFLFNALNAVAALLHTDAAAAERMLARLADLLRRSVDSQDAREVPLAEELQFVADYLEIQKTRFGPRLTTSIELEDRSLAYAAIPPLLLQPLVENSIKHGIARLRNGGHVAVRVSADGPWLRLQVRDNGPGCDPDSVFARGSIGVPNARARLEAVYGSRQSFEYRREGDEFVADLRLPLRTPAPRSSVA